MIKAHVTVHSPKGEEPAGTARNPFSLGGCEWLRSDRSIIVNDYLHMLLTHPGLKDLLSINQYSTEKAAGFLSIETHLPKIVKTITTQIPNYRVALHLRREYRHIAMGLRSLKLKDVDTIIVMEIYLQHVFITLPLLALTGKTVLLLLHGDQQFALKNWVKAIGLNYVKLFLKMAKFKAVLLEIDDTILPSEVQIPDVSKIVIPHPMRTDVEPRSQMGERSPADRPIKIGVVGIIRADKPIAKLVQQLKTYVANHPGTCELILGMPLNQKPSDMDWSGVTICDTTSEADYFKVLKDLDILVSFYNRDSYYYRASGVINDALCSGCFCIAPDYPVIRHQLTWPVEVGLMFTNLNQIDALLDQAIAHIRQHGQDNHWLWREQRSTKVLADLLLNQTPSAAV